MRNGGVRDQLTLVLCVMPGRPGRDQDDPHSCAWCRKERGGSIRGGRGPARDLMMEKGLWGTAWMPVSRAPAVLDTAEDSKDGGNMPGLDGGPEGLSRPVMSRESSF